MARVTYLRVSTTEQSVEAQRTALGASDKEFRDEGVSGGVLRLGQRQQGAESLPVPGCPCPGRKNRRWPLDFSNFL